VWCIDIVFDVTQRGTTVKFLTIVDEGSHFCISIVVSGRLAARDVVKPWRTQSCCTRTSFLADDNGGEFISQALQAWLKEAGIQTRFIEPGSPWQNGVNEKFQRPIPR